MPEARQVGVDQDESHEKDEAQHVHGIHDPDTTEELYGCGKALQGSF
jgi:hypothetical protein